MKSFLTTITVCIACVATTGAQQRLDTPPPLGPTPREQHVRQLIGQLLLDDVQRQETLRRVRLVNRASDTVLIAETKAALAVAEFRGEWDRIDKSRGERRDGACQGRCEELARAFEQETMKLRGAYAGLEEGIVRLVDFLNTRFSPSQRELISRVVADEIGFAAQRRGGDARGRTAPMPDPDSPPYPRARTATEAARRTNAAQTPAPRLRPLEPGVAAQRQFGQKQPAKGPVRAMPGDRIDKDAALGLMRGIPTRTVALVMKDLAMAAEEALDEPRPGIERR